MIGTAPRRLICSRNRLKSNGNSCLSRPFVSSAVRFISAKVGRAVVEVLDSLAIDVRLSTPNKTYFLLVFSIYIYIYYLLVVAYHRYVTRYLCLFLDFFVVRFVVHSTVVVVLPVPVDFLLPFYPFFYPVLYLQTD